MTPKALGKEQKEMLCRAILSLKTMDECEQFLEDLCTISEQMALAQRIEVAMLLDDGQIYRDILDATGASSATVSRVNRCLNYGAGGYTTIIKRLKENNL